MVHALVPFHGLGDEELPLESNLIEVAHQGEKLHAFRQVAVWLLASIILPVRGR